MIEEIKQKIARIDKLYNDVRAHINTMRYQNDLIRDSNNWNQICCSLDTVCDTLYSINDYVESEYPKKTGLRYIFTYGIIQSLFIQQDAIKYLSEAFDIEYKYSNRLLYIRDIRNGAVGHPVGQKRKIYGAKCIVYNYISRATLSKEGFTLMRRHNNGKNEFEVISLFPIINDQLDEITNAYKIITETLKKADKMHKDKYKGRLLIDIFGSSMEYLFEKVAEGINSSNRSSNNIGLPMLNIIQEIYKKFELALEDRKEMNIEYDLNKYNSALLKLIGYLSGDDNTMHKYDAEIYYYYIREENKHFEQIAQKIDSTYRE